MFVFTIFYRYSGLGSTLAALKDSMAARFKDYVADYNVILATYFDPRYKLTLYRSAADTSESDTTSKMHLDNITEELARVTQKRLTEIEVSSAATPHKTDSSEDGGLSANEVSDEGEDLDQEDIDFDNFDKCMDEIVSSQSTSKKLKRQTSRSRSTEKSNLQSIKEEMRLYENMEMLPRDENPFIWWHENGQRFPLLSVLASKYLSAPPSSVESERIFSVGGNVNTPKRNRLSPDTSESLMFLHHNLRIFDFEY